MQMEIVNEGVSVAKAVSEFGVMVVICGFFVVISSLVMVFVVRWFKSLIDGIIRENREMNSEAIGDYKEMMSTLLEETRKQNEQLLDISEGLRPETEVRIKNVADVYFDYSVEAVLAVIRKVKEENHIADRNATREKILMLLQNIHEERSSRFDAFSYRGRRLSKYVNREWSDWVARIVEREVYAERTNYDRSRTNVSAVYNRIRLDFYHRINAM